MSSSSPLPFNNLMERRKSGRRAASVDDLALVKAAAWAWYQHGSAASDRRHVREFELERPELKVHRPSRYKLESERVVLSNHHQHSSSAIPVFMSTTSPDDQGSYISDLLDKYEIQRISVQLDRYIETSHAAAGDRRSVLSLPARERKKNKKPSSSSSSSSSKGFWMRHAALCGSSSDVVEAGRVGCSRWPRPPKYIPTAKTVGCGPRASYCM